MPLAQTQILEKEIIEPSTLRKSITQNLHSEIYLWYLPDQKLVGPLSLLIGSFSDNLRTELESVTDEDTHSLEHIATGSAALNKITYMLKAIALNDHEGDDALLASFPEKRDTLTFGQSETEMIDQAKIDFPNLKVTNDLLGTEYFIRGLYNQWKTELTDKASSDFVADLYKRIDEYYGGVGAAERHYTNHDKVRQELAGTIRELIKEDLIDHSPEILIVGSSAGLGVEGPVLSQLMQEKELGNCKIIGIDPLPQSQHWAGMKLYQKTLEEYAKDHKSKAKVVILTGSVLNNFESLHQWLEFMRSLDEVTESGCVILYETGDIETNPGQNLRTKLSKKMNDQSPDKMWGMYGIIAAYRKPSDKEGTYGATLFPRAVYKWLLNLAGFGDWIGAKPYEANGPDDVRMIVVAKKDHASPLSAKLRDTLESLSRIFALPEQVKK